MTSDFTSDSAATLAGLGATRHEPLEVDGFQISSTVYPRDSEEVANVLSELQGSGLGLLVRGGGTALGRGNLARRADLVLATDAISGIDEFDRNDGVMHVRGGTALSEVQAVAGSEGWELPLDPPGEKATVGGVLARAGTGPRELGWGPARDCVLGLDVVLASGVRTHCGGRVVKNVTGFDLAKLYTGSLGALGVIDGAWLRLRPRPEAVQAFRGRGQDSGRLLDWALQASRRVSARAVAVASPRLASAIDAEETEDWHWWVELAGESAAVERDADWLRAQGSEVGQAPNGLAEVRTFQGQCLEPNGLRARLDLVPTCLAEVSEKLSPLAAGQLIYPGLGTLYAYADAQAVEPVAKSCLDAIAKVDGQRPRGRICLESLPSAAKAGRDVFFLPGGERTLLDALKQRFDPERLLNPGRGPGGL